MSAIDWLPNYKINVRTLIPQMKLLENDIQIKSDMSNYPCLHDYRYKYNNNPATAIRQCKTWYVTNVCRVVYTFLKCTCGLTMRTTFLFTVFKLWMYMYSSFMLHSLLGR